MSQLRPNESNMRQASRRQASGLKAGGCAEQTDIGGVIVVRIGLEVIPVSAYHATLLQYLIVHPDTSSLYLTVAMYAVPPSSTSLSP